MAALALDLRLAMPRVAEEHEILHLVDLLRRERPRLIAQRRQPLDFRAVLLYRPVARHAFTDRRKRRLVARLNCRVAIPAFDLERCVPLVAELDRLLRTP